jgi:hypothetical protein
LHTISRPPVTITCVERVSRDLAEKWIAEHPDWFRAGAGAGASAGGAVGPGRTVRVDVEGTPGVAKREAATLPKRLLCALVGRAGRSRKAFEIGVELAGSRVEAARPLALIEVGHGKLVRWSCVVFQAIEGTTLRSFILERVAGLDPGEAPGEARDVLKHGLWSAIAAQVAHLHAACMRQRDLKAPNILISRDREGAFRASLIDLEGMTKLASPPSTRVRARDLARLAVSLREGRIAAAGVGAEDWRFLVASYLEEAFGRKPSTIEIDGYVAHTVAWARKKEARNRRRRRVIN